MRTNMQRYYTGNNFKCLSARINRNNNFQKI